MINRGRDINGKVSIRENAVSVSSRQIRKWTLRFLWRKTNDIKLRWNRKEPCSDSKIINHGLTLTEDPQQLSELENYQEFGLRVFS